jgi:hypothetical protein
MTTPFDPDELIGRAVRLRPEARFTVLSPYAGQTGRVATVTHDLAGTWNATVDWSDGVRVTYPVSSVERVPDEQGAPHA